MPGLPARLAELAALRCHDASLLRYVGPDPRRPLGEAGRRRLAAIIADAPLPCRRSVCFGDRVPVPRLFKGAVRRKRLAVMGDRHAASVAAFNGSALRVQASFWLDQPRPQKGRPTEPRVIDEARLEAALRASLPNDAASTRSLSKNWQGLVAAVNTEAPALALPAIAAVAGELDSNVSVGAQETAPLALALRRLIDATRR